MNFKTIVVVFSVIFIVSCATVPYTGRKQFNIYSHEAEIQLGQDAYRQILKENRRTSNSDYQQMIKRVGNRIATAAGQSHYQWEFNVLKGDSVNAFALPGGKVAFWEGIIPICETETGVAVVMGHEVAHVLARHGAERMSQGMSAAVLAEIISRRFEDSDKQTRDRIMKFYGLGAQVGVLLPFGRKHESESDRIGLILMAKAGYDPREAANFWKRMSKIGGPRPPEFLSTHPSSERRIAQIESWLPEALKYFKP